MKSSMRLRARAMFSQPGRTAIRAIFAVLIAGTARAEAPDPHLEAAKKLLAAGKTTEACAELQAGKEAGGTMLVRVELGKCYEALGKTASAYAEYFDAATSDEAEQKPELAALASSRAAAVEKQLYRLTI